MKELEAIKSRLQDRSFFEAATYKRPAAILVPLIQKEGKLQLLFEVRSHTISQGGDICFPGGAIDEDETPFEAAVRETKEELFVKDNQIEVLAPLHLLQGPRGKMVYSISGEIKDYDGKYSKDEVDHVFTLPLDFFMEYPPFHYDSQLQSIRGKGFPYDLIRGGRNYHFQDHITRRLFFYKTPEGTIWGLTAEAIYRFTEVLASTNRA